MIIQLHYGRYVKEDTTLEDAIRTAFGRPSVVADALLAWPEILCGWHPEESIAFYTSRTEAGALWLAMNAPACAQILEA